MLKRSLLTLTGLTALVLTTALVVRADDDQRRAAILRMPLVHLAGVETNLISAPPATVSAALDANGALAGMVYNSPDEKNLSQRKIRVFLPEEIQKGVVLKEKTGIFHVEIARLVAPRLNLNEGGDVILDIIGRYRVGKANIRHQIQMELVRDSSGKWALQTNDSKGRSEFDGIYLLARSDERGIATVRFTNGPSVRGLPAVDSLEFQAEDDK